MLKKKIKSPSIKNNSRMISIFCIGVFISAIILLALTITHICIKYYEHQVLLEQKQTLQNQLNYANEIKGIVVDDYYVVYAEGQYTIDQQGEIIVIYE